MITRIQVYCSYKMKSMKARGLPDARQATEMQVAASVESFKGLANASGWACAICAGGNIS